MDEESRNTTNGVDADRTIPPRSVHDDTAKTNDSFDPDRTVMGMRVRRERGELREGDVVLGRYELLERLGAGAMGVVFKCRDKVSQVEYAVKMVPPELARDADAMEEVRENFRLVYNLNHPDIAGAKFLDRDEYGAYFLVMEYAPGENLSQWIKRQWKAGGPKPEEVASIVKQIASALDYAHGERILHRDIKPANVMVDEAGRVKGLDFGLASKVRNTMTALSINPANTSGTPNYLAPEQFKGKYPTPAADQYALGVIAYQMLAGHLPFESDDLGVLRAIVAAERPDRIEGVPEAVNACLQKVLAKEPKERFASCSDFAAALEAATKEPAPQPAETAAAASPPPPTTKNRRMWWLIGGAVALIALAAAAVLSVISRKDESERATADLTVALSDDVKLELVKVEAGTFTMGARDGGNAALGEKEHRVTLTRDFYIGKTEVTQAQYQAVMGYNPSHHKGDDLPVEQVDWNDAMKFCEKLNQMGKAPEGWKFTLPTEAQWEYAARGGNKSRGYKYSGSGDLDEVAWYRANSRYGTRPVAQKKANELGLYDMSGNVKEWCRDWYESGYAGDPEFLVGNSGSYRIHRGGYYLSEDRECRLACRSFNDPEYRFSDLGFRLALVQIK